MWCVATYPYGLWYQFGDVSVHVRHALENRSNYGIFLGLAHAAMKPMRSICLACSGLLL